MCGARARDRTLWHRTFGWLSGRVAEAVDEASERLALALDGGGELGTLRSVEQPLHRAERGERVDGEPAGVVVGDVEQLVRLAELPRETDGVRLGAADPLRR